MAPSLQPTLGDLLIKVNELSESFTKYLSGNGIPLPTFEADSATQYDGLTSEAFVMRQQLLDHLTDLQYLVQGPSESVFNYAHNVRWQICLLFR
ncbi:hypothetical protein IMZ48_02310 [Candidatus Bathyarchaeota archaeon]|nr:hypothetical protein [Candidatus Bathyarchaeota archaeon]